MTTILEVESLDQEIATLQAKRQAILDGKRNDALQGVKDTIRTFGFTAQELGLVATVKASGASSKAKAEAKYQNPNNSAETWHGGKGPRPKWVKAYMEQGGDIETCLIKK